MRIFAVFAVCIFAVGQAMANDAPTKDAAHAASASAAGHGAPSASAARAASSRGASASASASASVPAKPVKPSASAITGALAAKDKRGGAPSNAASSAREEMSESELALKVAERVAAMRKAQAARVAAAARAKKEKEKARAETPAATAHHADHWSYEGETGPEMWGKINTNWAVCGSGTRQSPIDIRDGIKVELEPIGFDYKPSSFSVTDNGHTIQVTVGGGNYITIMNRMYELVQFHFHRPSEERVNGRSAEMVVHLVHKDPQGRLAVIAVLIERGKAQRLIQTIWNNLPLEKGDSLAPNIVLDMNDILPVRRDYYTFMGSLTTPPCTEGVLWMVMKEAIQASPEQMALFSRLYPLNARPTQPTAGRMIKESN